MCGSINHPELIHLILLAALTENLSTRRNLGARENGAGGYTRTGTRHLLPGHELELRQALAATLATALLLRRRWPVV